LIDLIYDEHWRDSEWQIERGNRRHARQFRMSVDRHSIYEVANDALGPSLRWYRRTCQV